MMEHVESKQRKCKCFDRCGKIIEYDPELAPPPFFEVDTGIHHTFKRCGSLQEENGYVKNFMEIQMNESTKVIQGGLERYGLC